MKYQLINKINPNYSTIQQILTNRGIPFNEISHYMNTTDEDINSPLLLGKEKLKNAAAALTQAILSNESVLIIVDCDCDGFTSSALLINYLYDVFPSWVENNLYWFLHEEKEHGLGDCMEYISQRQFSLIIVPDAGSNDYQYHKQLKQQGRTVIILDHHEAEFISSDAIIINNQLCDYPNKEFSGVGIVWQFCRYLDSLLNKDFANNYLDLVALGLTADMMSLQSLETKHLILKGFKEENIRNPFIYGMVEKNSYSLGSKVTPIGAAFYIAPFVNAMVRSGTLEEKELLFNSMLKFKAFDIVLSNKRGHKLGETEKLVEQALRTATNVKNRQTRAQDAGMELIEHLIEENHMMEHKVLLFLLEPGQIDKNIAGLCANKIMAKYQRPCCILTRVEVIDENIILTSLPPQQYKYDTYQGSARGCDKVGITNFKDICTETECIMYAEGHQGAFGLGIAAWQIDNFIKRTDELLKDMSDEPIYYVDYIYEGYNVNPENILDIASLDDLWGKEMDEALVAIKDLKVTKDMITLMSPDKKPTLKITLPNRVALIKFNSNEDEYENLLSEEGYIAIDIVGRCNQNNWMGNIYPQILIEEYQIVGQCKYIF